MDHLTQVLIPGTGCNFIVGFTSVDISTTKAVDAETGQLCEHERQAMERLLGASLPALEIMDWDTVLGGQPDPPGLGWAGLGWAGLGWVGLGWAGLGWAGLGWPRRTAWGRLTLARLARIARRTAWGRLTLARLARIARRTAWGRLTLARLARTTRRSGRN